MLVPTVLRNIVLPYLRAGPSSTAAGASAGTHATTTVTALAMSRRRHARQIRAASISSSTRQARPAEAAATRDSADASFRIWDPPFVRLPPPQRPPPEPPRASSRAAPQGDSSGARSGRAELPEHQQKPTPTPRAEEAATRRSTEPTASDSRRAARVDMPPAVQKLLHAKLYRMAVFHIIRTPELMTNAALVVHVVELLEKRGAGKLALRLRESMDLRRRADVDAGEPVRLWSSRSKSDVPRPPTWWRLPVIPRDVESYPEATAQERATHYYNHLLTSYLYKAHAAPYAAPIRPGDGKPRGPLGGLRKTLKFVEYLRARRGFVPDRVTVNILVKAWLSAMALNTEGHGADARARPGRQGLGSSELRGIFDVVARTIERDIASLQEPGARAPGQPGQPSQPATPDSPFNRAISYEHHVKPFGNMMRRAFARVGDHEARIAAERWMWRVAQRLGVDEAALHAAVRKAGREMAKESAGAKKQK